MRQRTEREAPSEHVSSHSSERKRKKTFILQLLDDKKNRE
jgi:hypothetical protein